MKHLYFALALVTMGVWGCADASAELGDSPPPLSIAHWIQGKPVDLKAGKNKNIYVIEFWATWCPTCVANIPHYSELQKKFKDQNVVFVSVTSEDPEPVKQFVKKMGDKMNYTVAIDDSQKTFGNFMAAFDLDNPLPIPYAFVIDKAGQVVWHGPALNIDKVVEQVVGGKFDIAAAKVEIAAFKKARLVEKQVSTYLSTVINSGRTAEIDALGKQIVTDGAANPGMLTQLALIIITDSRMKDRDVALALSAAKTAYDKAGGKELVAANVYAIALFVNGKATDAIKLQKQTIELCKDEQALSVLKQNLQLFESRMEKAAPPPQ